MRVPALIRSGWWVAAVAVAISLGTAWILIEPLLTRPGAIPQDFDFALDRVTVPRDLVVRAMAKDGVRVLTNPPTMTPADIDRSNEGRHGKLLVPDDRVIGLVIGGQARAYPFRLMRWHEVVNDVVGREPVAITYSPLCDSVAVYSRSVGGEVVELGVSGYLYNSNTLLYDARVDSAETPLWLQFDGRVVAGPNTGSSSPLQLRVAELATWGEWRARHPDTRVLAPQPELEKLYRRDPYHSYFGSDVLHFPVRPLPPEGPYRLKDRFVVVTVDGFDTAFALRDLAATAGAGSGEVEVEASGLPLRISFRVDPGTALVEPLRESARLEAVRYTFWFAWYSLGGMIPGMEDIPEPRTRLESPTTSPGGA
jgi:hypothetical protein